MNGCNLPHAALFFLLFFFSFFKLSYCIENKTPFCPEIEKQSLLKLKESLIDQNNLLSSWDHHREANCCKWSGVVCNNLTGRVQQLHLRGLYGKINPSLLNLKDLRHLDLSESRMVGEPIPSFIGSLVNLEYLNLSSSRYLGKIPYSIGNLSNLHTLDLGLNGDLHADSLEWLLPLSQLEHLNMDYVDLSEAHSWPQVINALPSLVQVHFQYCNFDYSAQLDYVNTTSLKHLYLAGQNLQHSVSIPPWIFQLGSLLSLDLSGNAFIGPIPAFSNATKLIHIDLSLNDLDSNIPDWLYTCKHLEFVGLTSNRLNGTISNSVENLTSLNTLLASANQFSGELPKGIANLCKIQRLDLSKNNIEGEIFGNKSECFLEALEIMRLSENQLSGYLTNRFGEFKSLRHVDVGRNSLSGVIPINIGKSSSLEELLLYDNKFTGALPESLSQLLNLRLLNIGGNMLEGAATESHFTHLTKLEALFASGNHLTLNVSPNWDPPFQLTALHMGSWNLGAGSQIPSWLESQTNMLYLDLSSTGISGSIPSWVWKIPILILFNNRLHGEIPDLLGKDQYIYLGSNQFSGSIPRIADTVQHLDLSNNSFSGGISHLLCDIRYRTYELSVLHLGGNQLSGELPDCFTKWPLLRYLNLGNNSNMSGTIPSSIGYLAQLQSLSLNGIGLSGEIPSSLRRCVWLVKMDLGDNHLVGGVPTWVGTDLVELTFLILSSNRLSGEISPEICHLNSLQILDLSDNKFSGLIPRCLSNFTAMATKRSFDRQRFSFSVYWSTFIDSASVAIKGSEFQYGTTLSLVTNINLSKNNLSGDIPKELTSLVELRSLNLSQNRLTGSIPENIGDMMKQLESLDLSRNFLSGQIPDSFTLLSSLNHLNLSHNSLTGRIPKSTQLQSLDASSFSGNNLCGPPLTVSCSDDGEEVDGHNEEDEDEDEGEGEIEWFYVFLSLGYAVGFSGVCSALELNKAWGETFLGFVERMWDKLYLCVCIRWIRLTRPSDPSS